MKLEDKVIKWAEDKGLTNSKNAKTQFLKTVEEVGELSNALLKDDNDLIIDAVGDIVVTLIIFCKIRNLKIDDCLAQAWNEIKDRTGSTVNGTFIKNS